MSQSLKKNCRHARNLTDVPEVKRLLPLITALILALYVAVPGEFDSRVDYAGAAVTELQDDIVGTSPRHDDQALTPVELQLALLSIPGSIPLPAPVKRAFYQPSVPNIRDPPLCSAV